VSPYYRRSHTTAVISYVELYSTKQLPHFQSYWLVLSENRGPHSLVEVVAANKIPEIAHTICGLSFYTLTLFILCRILIP